MRRSLGPLLLALTFAAPLVLSPRSAGAQMSDTERKAAARSAYSEGVALQEAGKTAEALTRFEAAQKLYDAPTHLLRLAECQAKLGKLVEAGESYEVLSRKQLGPDAPEAFVEAQKTGREEAPALRARIPTLRLGVKPDPAQLPNLQVSVNGAAIPTELLGIARPVNPGSYRLSATATGWATPAPIDVEMREKDARAVDLVLVRSAVAVPPAVAPVVTGTSPGTGTTPPPGAGTTPTPPSAPASAQAPAGSTNSGLLLGAHTGLFVPGGKIYEGVPFDDAASSGPGIGLDVWLRLVKTLLLGVTYEYAAFAKPTVATVSPSSSYFGLGLGVVSNIDKFAFTADMGIGRRWLTAGVNGQRTTPSALAFQLGIGFMIPAGPIRIAPRAALSFASFGARDPSECVDDPSCALSRGIGFDATLHSVIFLGVGVFYNIDFGSKKH